MKKPLLSCKVHCKDEAPPVFEGKDLQIDIVVTNVHGTAVDFPLEYVQSGGPAVKLTAKSNKEEVYLKRNLSDRALQEKFTTIPPGKSLTVQWIITAGELTQYGGSPVDVSAEFTIITKIRADGATVDFKGTDVMRIAEKSAL